MPTIKQAFQQLDNIIGSALENAFQNPKTTLSSILTTALTGIPVLLATGVIHGKLASIAFSALGLCKLVLGTFFQKDAGSIQATLPGSIVPQSVPSHEVPDNPEAKPVIPQP